MKRLLTIALFVLSAVGTPARAEIAVLTNGMTFKITARRTEGDSVYLSLKDGGEVGAPLALIRGFVPDEIVDEVAPAPNDATDLRQMAAAAATRHGLDPALVAAVVEVESGFVPTAVSPKGAQGLMQLMPHTATGLGVQDAFDPALNLDGGARYLQSLLQQYGGNVEKALAAYNAGPGAVERHGGVPPYRETRGYVRKVLERYNRAR